MREQFRVAIAPYVLDGHAPALLSAETGEKVHRKRRASERLSSSPAVRGLLRAPKRARLESSPDHGDVEESEAHHDRSVRHLDLAAKYHSVESKRRARGGRER